MNTGASGRRVRPVSILALGLLVAVPVGCGEGDLASTWHEAAPPWPTWESPGGGAAGAEVSGTLTLEDDCLSVRFPDGLTYAVVLPGDSALLVDDDDQPRGVRLRDGTVVQLGVPFSGGGSYFTPAPELTEVVNYVDHCDLGDEVAVLSSAEQDA